MVIPWGKSLLRWAYGIWDFLGFLKQIKNIKLRIVTDIKDFWRCIETCPDLKKVGCSVVEFLHLCWRPFEYSWDFYYIYGIFWDFFSISNPSPPLSGWNIAVSKAKALEHLLKILAESSKVPENSRRHCELAAHAFHQAVRGESLAAESESLWLTFYGPIFSCHDDLRTTWSDPTDTQFCVANYLQHRKCFIALKNS